MNRDELQSACANDQIVIEASHILLIHTLACQLGAGEPPRGDACFAWGKVLHSIADQAELLPPPGRRARMTNEECFKLARALRDEGFAVVVFTAEELRGADPGLVEYLMVERGWNAIETLAEEGQDEVLTPQQLDPFL